MTQTTGAATGGRRARGGSIAARFFLYQAAAWGTIAALARGAPALVLVALLALYTLVPLVLFVRWRGWPFYPGAAFRLLVVRPALYAQLLLPIVAAAALVGGAIGLAFGAPLAGARLGAAIVAAAAGALLVAGWAGSRTLVVRHVEAYLPSLAPALEGLRLAQISDLHVGPHTPRRFLDEVRRAVESLAPDVIAVTGDLVDDRAEDVAHYAAAFASLRAPLGVYCIPGNHDVYAGWRAVAAGLAAATPATVLVNASRVVERGTARLAIVGTGDPAGGSSGTAGGAPDVARALAGVPNDALVVAFAHNPALWPRLAERGVALTLSGHTHWGQLALPRLGWSLASPFLEHAMGGHVAGRALLYINPGTGFWGLPFRLGALPEVTLVTLRAAEHGEATLRVAPATRPGAASAPRRWRRAERLVYSAATD